MANTFELIASSTVGVLGSSTISFTSIPSTYTDLCLKLSLRSTNTQIYDYLYVNFNSNGYNSTIRYLQGSGSAVTCNSESTGYLGIINGTTATASTFSNNEVYIPNYAGSSYKSFSVDGTEENNASTSYMHLVAGIWSNTAAINSITLKPDTNTFVQYSTAYLYGVKNA